MLVDDKRNHVPASVPYSNFVNARDRTMELMLQPSDRPYVLLPAMFEPGPGCGGSPEWFVSASLAILPTVHLLVFRCINLTDSIHVC
eukprot:COSAG02_NODE_20081_length_849_cov_1.217333_1_plen_87_part_00